MTETKTITKKYDSFSLQWNLIVKFIKQKYFSFSNRSNRFLYFETIFEGRKTFYLGRIVDVVMLMYLKTIYFLTQIFKTFERVEILIFSIFSISSATPI